MMVALFIATGALCLAIIFGATLISQAIEAQRFMLYEAIFGDKGKDRNGAGK